MDENTNDTSGTGPADDATQPMPPTGPAAAAQPGPGAPAGPAAQPGPMPQATYAAAPAAPAAPARKSRAPWIIGGAVAGVLLLGGGVAAGALIGRTGEDVTVQRVTTVDPATDQSGTGSSNDTGSSNSGSSGSTGSSDNTGSSSAGAATSTQDIRIANDEDIELTGDTLTRAAAAAMQAAGGEGVITSAEYSDDPTHRYEIEIQRNDRMEMDVYLDADFQVVATKQWHH